MSLSEPSSPRNPSLSAEANLEPPAELPQVVTSRPPSLSARSPSVPRQSDGVEPDPLALVDPAPTELPVTRGSLPRSIPNERLSQPDNASRLSGPPPVDDVRHPSVPNRASGPEAPRRSGPEPAARPPSLASTEQRSTRENSDPIGGSSYKSGSISNQVKKSEPGRETAGAGARETQATDNNDLPESATISQLLVLALKTPDYGVVNFRSLFVLLDHVITRLEMGDEKVDLTERPSRDNLREAVRTLPTAGTRLPTKSPSEIVDFRNQKKINELEQKVSTLRMQMEAFQDLPTTERLVEKAERPGSIDDTSRESRKSAPMIEAWQTAQVSKRMDATEQSLRKSLTVVDELLEEVNRIKNMKKGLMQYIQKWMYNPDAAFAQALNGETFVDDGEEEEPQVPAKFPFVTWPALRESLINRQHDERLSLEEQHPVFKLFGPMLDPVEEDVEMAKPVSRSSTPARTSTPASPRPSPPPSPQPEETLDKEARQENAEEKAKEPAIGTEEVKNESDQPDRVKSPAVSAPVDSAVAEPQPAAPSAESPSSKPELPPAPPRASDPVPAPAAANATEKPTVPEQPPTQSVPEQENKQSTPGQQPKTSEEKPKKSEEHPKKSEDPPKKSQDHHKKPEEHVKKPEHHQPKHSEQQAKQSVPDQTPKQSHPQSLAPPKISLPPRDPDEPEAPAPHAPEGDHSDENSSPSSSPRASPGLRATRDSLRGESHMDVPSFIAEPDNEVLDSLVKIGRLVKWSRRMEARLARLEGYLANVANKQDLKHISDGLAEFRKSLGPLSEWISDWGPSHIGAEPWQEQLEPEPLPPPKPSAPAAVEPPPSIIPSPPLIRRTLQDPTDGAAIATQLKDLWLAIELQKRCFEELQNRLNFMATELQGLTSKLKEQASKMVTAPSRVPLLPQIQQGRTSGIERPACAIGPTRPEFDIFCRAAAENFQMIEGRIADIERTFTICQQKLENLQELMNRLDRVKADADQVGTLISPKADASELRHKVDKHQFMEVANILQQKLLDVAEDLRQQENSFNNYLRGLDNQVENIMNDDTYQQLVEQTNRNLHMIHNRVIQLESLLELDSAAGAKRAINPYKCVSCDKPAEPAMVRPVGWPQAYVTDSIRPHLEYMKYHMIQGGDNNDLQRYKEIKCRNVALGRQLQRHMREQECLEFKQAAAYTGNAKFPHMDQNGTRVGKRAALTGRPERNPRKLIEDRLDTFVKKNNLAIQFPSSARNPKSNSLPEIPGMPDIEIRSSRYPNSAPRRRTDKNISTSLDAQSLQPGLQEFKRTDEPGIDTTLPNSAVGILPETKNQSLRTQPENPAERPGQDVVRTSLTQAEKVQPGQPTDLTTAVPPTAELQQGPVKVSIPAVPPASTTQELPKRETLSQLPNVDVIMAQAETVPRRPTVPVEQGPPGGPQDPPVVLEPPPST